MEFKQSRCAVGLEKEKALMIRVCCAIKQSGNGNYFNEGLIVWPLWSGLTQLPPTIQ